jgi:hypothetical protein
MSRSITRNPPTWSVREFRPASFQPPCSCYATAVKTRLGSDGTRKLLLLAVVVAVVDDPLLNLTVERNFARQACWEITSYGFRIQAAGPCGRGHALKI